MKDFGAECRDVRFREVGVSILQIVSDDYDPALIRHADP